MQTTRLLAENEDDLQRLLNKFENTASILNMLISTEKTQFMVTSKEPIRCKLMAHNKIIQQVLKFNYLGTVISSDRYLTEEIRMQANKTNDIAGYLRDIIWKNRSMLTERAKWKIYKTCVRPILIYATETRVETSRTKRILRTMEINTLRAIRGVTRRNKLRNEQIRKDCNIQDILK